MPFNCWVLGLKEECQQVLTLEGTRALRTPAFVFSKMQTPRPSLVDMLHRQVQVHIGSDPSSIMCVPGNFAEVT